MYCCVYSVYFLLHHIFPLNNNNETKGDLKNDFDNVTRHVKVYALMLSVDVSDAS